MTQMNIYTKQKQTHIEITPIVAKGEGWRASEQLGIWGHQMQPVTYRMDEQLGPTV